MLNPPDSPTISILNWPIGIDGAMSDIDCEKCNGQLEKEISSFYVCDTYGCNVAPHFLKGQTGTIYE